MLFFKKINSNDSYSKLKVWIKLISITGAAQSVVQITSVLSGILVVRLLPINEYALYTLANTMLATMTILADGGISVGVMAEGGKVWQNKNELGTVLITGLTLKRKFALVSLFVTLPILFYSLKTHNANWLTVILISGALIPAFLAALSDSLLEVVPRLHQDIVRIQKNQLTVSILRLILNCLLLFIFPFTFLAILATGLPRIYGNIKLKTLSNKFIVEDALPSKEVSKNIMKTVNKMLPEMIYYCLSGQISIWLISFFGSTQSLAGLGAIGRLSMIINIFSVMVYTLVTPRFSRLPNTTKLYKYGAISLFFVIVIGFVLVILGFIFSGPILWLLGNSYAGLKNELFLSILSGSISLVVGTVFGLNLSRGWVINPLYYIPLSILYTIAAILFVKNISTISGVLIFNILVSILQGLTLFIYGIMQINKLK